MPLIELSVNGTSRAVDTHEGATLLEVLREGCSLTSPKDGCSPTGQCGCCTVLVDGQAKVACAMPADRAVGREVVTLEGIDERTRRVFARAFAVTAGVQCGFCIPGIVVRAHNIIKRTPLPTRAEIAQGLGAHLCRCTGYVKIVDAVELAAQVLHGDVELPEGDWSGRVGTSLPKYEAEELTLGDRKYIDDLTLPAMLHGALVMSAHPRARVRAIDASAALALPGVHAVIGAADVPGQRYQGLIYPDWPVFVAIGEETRYTGDIIAAVAAETRHLARRAAALVRVDYEVLEPLTSTAQALAADAPLLHPENGHADNVLSSSHTRRGDAEAALASAAHVVTGTWKTQMIEHAFLEPESCLAVPPGGIDVSGATAQLLQIYSQGQGVYDDQRQIGSALGLAAEALRVTLVSCGGAFGGKEDLSIQAQTSLLALVTGRPVKLTIDRVESIRLHPKRHPIEMTYTVGCDSDGKLTAIKVRLIGDKGAYASVGSKVIERACGHATGAYDIAHVDIEGVAVYTNNPPCGAMRGFGANQSGFAIESCLDMLAERLGIDAWEMRWRNALVDGSRFCSGQLLNAVGLRATLQKVKPDYDAARAAGKAVGLACGIKNVGIGNGMPDIGRAALTIEKDGSITLANGYTEMGQGLYTVLIQMASEVTGLDPRLFRATVDTNDRVQSGMTTASRATVCGGRAVVDAGRKLKAALDEAGGDLASLCGRTFNGEFIYDKTSKLGAPVENPITHLSFGYATQLVILDERGRIEQLIAAHDVGRVINPKLLEGQIEGSIHMGLGFALSEELIVDECVIQNATLRGIGVLRAQWMPRLDIRFVEEPEPEGPFGAKGVGEIGLLPTAPAVANALYRFDGVRRYALPMKDSPAARHITGKKPAASVPQ